MKDAAIKKEWSKVIKQEQAYLRKHMQKGSSRLNRMLEEKVPDNLQDTLDAAFFKAFQLVFQKGTGLIEKTYNKEKHQMDHQINTYAVRQKGDKRSLRAFSKNAKSAGYLNTAASGVSGIGLGLLGVGIPDIFLFTGMMLRNVYEIALSYGFGYEEPAERRFILMVIEGALSEGAALGGINKTINGFIAHGAFAEEEELETQIRRAAQCLSGEMLYMKFLQGIPVAGVIGGAYDGVYMRRIAKYAELKYRRRFFAERMSKIAEKAE